MNLSYVIISFAVGFILGILIAWTLKLAKTKTAKELAEEIFRENETHRKADIESLVENIKDSFGNLSLEALSKSTEEFLKLAHTHLKSEREVNIKELESKKNLIDQQLQHMTIELGNVSKIMQNLEKDRIEKFGELTHQLKNTNEQTSILAQTTNMLKEALSSTKVRGQWGERMAEDVLQLAGFIENVNYLKQKTIEDVGTRPDFTFLLPQSLKLNMDVKFPLDNYLRYLDTQSDIDKIKFKNDFLKDVKARIKEVTTREYINPNQNTVDYVLLFIPNEQIYSFIHEQDSSILDEGIKNKVIFCSPITLFAVLAVIRQAVDNFSLQKISNQILSLFGNFKKQWYEFLKKLDSLGKKISDTQKEYDILTTTRRRSLEKPLNKIEDLRQQQGILSASDEEDTPMLEENKELNVK
ncbi:MAG: DNA recombination protein RmuC [bacterium]|nr:DNA recombination protein RmuC [bacterium]